MEHVAILLDRTGEVSLVLQAEGIDGADGANDCEAIASDQPDPATVSTTKDLAMVTSGAGRVKVHHNDGSRQLEPQRGVAALDDLPAVIAITRFSAGDYEPFDQDRVVGCNDPLHHDGAAGRETIEIIADAGKRVSIAFGA